MYNNEIRKQISLMHEKGIKECVICIYMYYNKTIKQVSKNIVTLKLNTYEE